MNNNTIIYMGRLLTFASISFLFAISAFAMPESFDKDELVNKVIQTYGGKKLTELKSLKVHDRYKVFSMDQGPNPMFNSISTLYSTLAIDFNSGRKSVNNWRQDSNGNRLSQILFDGKTGWSINHLRGTHVENSALTADVVGANMMQMIDTILARRLERHRDSVKLISRNSVTGKPIHTLSFVAEKNNQYFLDIDASSGLILRMSKDNDRTTGRVYEYGKHKQIQGLTFATDMNMLVKGKPSFITLSRTIEVNKVNQQSFSIPKASTRLKGLIERSKMSVHQLADRVYLAGEGNNFSIFIDAGDFYIGAGGLPGLKKRLEAVNNYVGSKKPIKEQVIPDHHRGHLGAIKELEEMGASVVIAPAHRNIIESLFVDKQQNKIRVVDNKMHLANGLVEVYNIHTVHAENYLLFFIPSAKLVFSADHFGTNLIAALPGANNTIKSFHSEIERLNIPVQKYAHAHGPRILSHADLEKVLAGYRVKPCPANNKICLD
ncbi:hypothetical protein SG34_031850 [Thalassomonas viridans]|uniref:Metallo-beta-lactamase domain-containing protein n=1 Tax=Thalassomonas viridans TaxID=137584 RepID=A0AAF0CCK6_9GAMM|nr:hypothetical protein [Thalassomonas viridans]WDE08518.1 hypothetical protein SG34_031850 [Thalassomonas viridans]